MSLLSVFVKYRALIDQLVMRDIKTKYRRSVLGLLWTVLNPLLMMTVLSIVFSYFFSRYGDVENFPVYLFTGRMLYDFLKASTTNAMKSVTGNAALLKKVYIPKYIFTFAKVTSCMVDMVLSMGALLIVMVVTRAPFYWQFLLCPVVILQLYIFCCGLGFLLAELTVFFRDIQYIYNAVLTAWLYLTPIMYPLDALKNVKPLVFLIKGFNPLYYYVAQFRDLIYYGRLPGPRVFFGGWIIAFVMLGIGVWCFQKAKDKFILYI